MIVGLGNGEPKTIVDALEADADELTEQVRLHQMLPVRDRAYFEGAVEGLRHVSWFLSPHNKDAFHRGECDLVPNNFSEIPALMRRTMAEPLVIAAVAPPDPHGWFSLGTHAEYTAAMIGELPFFLEVNSRMPRTFGENQVHISQVAGWCRADYELDETPSLVPDERDKRIAAFVAERIPNGACIQVGVGRIPNALIAALSGHRHLGVHTEAMSDGIMDLVEKGVITGTRKKQGHNKHVASFCVGTRQFFDWLDGNSAVALMPVDWVNDPRIIAREPNMASINATSEIDLMGQAASETIAGRYWSGSGGQADFSRGALYSDGGQAFLVTHATSSDGRSRIKVNLGSATPVTTLKNTVDHVVTEFGVAELRGRTISERARALIAIAHPDHRPELRQAMAGRRLFSAVP